MVLFCILSYDAENLYTFKQGTKLSKFLFSVDLDINSWNTRPLNLAIFGFAGGCLRKIDENRPKLEKPRIFVNFFKKVSILIYQSLVLKQAF